MVAEPEVETIAKEAMIHRFTKEKMGLQVIINSAGQGDFAQMKVFLTTVSCTARTCISVHTNVGSDVRDRHISTLLWVNKGNFQSQME